MSTTKPVAEMSSDEIDSFLDDLLDETPRDDRHLLLDPEGVAEAWGQKAYPTGRNAIAYITVKNIWDNYSNPKGMGKTASLIYEIERIFPDLEAAHRKRPLGEFKDLLDMPYDEIYEVLATRMTDWHTTKDGETKSFVEAIWPHARELIAKHMEDYQQLSRVEFFRGISLMLYGSMDGIWLEGETSRLLARSFEESKLGKRFRYEEAPYTMEKEDVDGVVIDKQTEEIVCCISIKSKKALSQHTVDTYRKPRSEGGKGKTRPDIYCGFESIYAGSQADLKWIEVDGRSLKTILREAIA